MKKSPHIKKNDRKKINSTRHGTRNRHNVSLNSPRRRKHTAILPSLALKPTPNISCQSPLARSNAPSFPKPISNPHSPSSKQRKRLLFSADRVHTSPASDWGAPVNHSVFPLLSSQLSPIATQLQNAHRRHPSSSSFLQQKPLSQSNPAIQFLNNLSPNPIKLSPRSTSLGGRHHQRSQPRIGPHRRHMSFSPHQNESTSSPPHLYPPPVVPTRSAAFTKTLVLISRLSRFLTPKLAKISHLVKSGFIKVMGSLTLFLAKHIEPFTNAIADQLENSLLKIDKTVASQWSVKDEQISALRTQVVAIIANSIVALSKAFAAYISNSGVMLAEALHSLADLSNQSLLLFGTVKALRSSDALHPYGYGAAKYIYGVLSASGVFFISCALTMYHAIAQYFDDSHVVELTWLTCAVLAVSFIVEGYSLFTASKTIKQLAKSDNQTFSEYVRSGRETTTIAVFVEDTVAMVGLTIAIATTALTHLYQNNIYDTIGTGGIALAMAFVSFFLFHRNESYVLGTSFSPSEQNDLLVALRQRASVRGVHDLKAVHYGEGDSRVKAEIVYDGLVIAKQVLDERKLLPVTLPYASDPATTAVAASALAGQTTPGATTPTTPPNNSLPAVMSPAMLEMFSQATPIDFSQDSINASSSTHVGQQHMIIGPDGTIAGHQIVHYLTTRGGLTSNEARNLLLRFGNECVQEVARETDQVEKGARKRLPQVTHLDLECHASSPHDDYSSEQFLFPYIEANHREKEFIAQKKRAAKSTAWAVNARTSFISLTQAMKGVPPPTLPIVTQTQPGSTAAAVVAVAAAQSGLIKSSPGTPSAQRAPNPSLKPQTATPPLPSSEQSYQDIALSSTGSPLHIGRYNQPVRAKELVQNRIYNDLLNMYQTVSGADIIDQTVTLFPYANVQSFFPSPPTIAASAAATPPAGSNPSDVHPATTPRAAAAAAKTAAAAAAAAKIAATSKFPTTQPSKPSDPIQNKSERRSVHTRVISQILDENTKVWGLYHHQPTSLASSSKFM